jgi:hypothetical protein
MPLADPNLEILKLAVDQLGELVDEMVFLGGCATGLLVTDPAADPIRTTDDVDAIVDVATRAQYYQLSERLRQHGFSEDTGEGAPVCRWVGNGITLDVMPVDDAILGFGGAWHRRALEHRESYQLAGGRQISIVSAPYFLITKMEAFNGRGNGDYLQSHDIEDIVAVLDGRAEILKEIGEADAELKAGLIQRFAQLSQDQNFLDAIAGHMRPDETSQARVPAIIAIARGISELEFRGQHT